MYLEARISDFDEVIEPVEGSPGEKEVSPLVWLAGAYLALLFVWAIFRACFPDSLDTLNFWLPLSIAAGCLGGIIHLFRCNSMWMWSPIMSLLAAFAVFHGLGPLLHVVGDPIAIAYANQFARIDEEDLAATNMLNLVSLALILISFAAFFRLRTQVKFARPLEKMGTASKGVSLLTWVVVSLSLPLKYLVVLPYFLGWTDPGFVLPGSVVALGNLSFLCLFLLFYQAWMRNALLYIPAVILFSLEIGTGLLSFNKTEIIATLAVCFLGLYLARPSRLLAGSALSAIMIAYFVITPIVSKGRNYLRSNPATVSDRAGALDAVWHSDEDQSAANKQGWWTRLCYANAQSFALHQYDAGMVGTTFSLILPALIPRVLWPDKPIMTPGYDFNELATGNRRSSSAPGIFAEAYWNFGWAGVASTCTYLGLLLTWFTQVAFRHVKRRDLRWLPFGIGGLLTGASITDWFASTYVGGVLTFALYLLLVKVMMPGQEEGGFVQSLPRESA